VEREAWSVKRRKCDSSRPDTASPGNDGIDGILHLRFTVHAPRFTTPVQMRTNILRRYIHNKMSQ
jgi:hypothetical protein